MARLNLWRAEQPHFALHTWDSVEREFERMFNDMGRVLNPSLGGEYTAQGSVEPMMMNVPYAIEEEEGHYLLSFDIPGVSKEDVDIEINGNQLLVSGVRRARTEQKQGSSTINARRYGQFKRVFTLPDGINSDSIQAQYENGVLHLVVPKPESAKPRRINIEEGTGGGFFKKLLGKDKDKSSQEEGKKVS